MHELTLSGKPRDRGRAHGEELRVAIQSGIERWQDHLRPSIDPDELVARLTTETGFAAAAGRHAPDLVDEVRGIAEGSGQPFEKMLAWQLIDEGWWYLDELEGILTPVERCSVLAINHHGRGIVAQTQDLDRYFDGAQVMLRYIEPDGMEILVPSLAGLLALNGVNSAGLAVCITTLSPLPHSTDGVSSGFLVPLLLRCRSIEEALALLRSVPIASGNSFTLGTRDRSVVVEASATDMVVGHDGARALHTNHPLVLEPVWEYERFLHSRERLDQLEQAVDSTSTVDDLEAMYAVGPVCRSRTEDASHMTVMTTIMELSDVQRCHAAPGPLDSETVTTYEMTHEVARP